MDLTPEFSRLATTKGSSARRPKTQEKQPPRDPILAEAYLMITQFARLAAFLSHIQPLFLDVHRHSGKLSAALFRDSFSEADSALFGYELEEDANGFVAMSSVQRELVTARIKVFIEACVAKVTVLERGAGASIRGLNDGDKESSNNSGFFGSFLSAMSSSAVEAHKRHQKVLAEHRSSIVWLLRKRLMDVSNSFRKLQEQWIEIQKRRDEGFLNVHKQKAETPITKQVQATDFLSGISATVNRAAALATTIAHAKLDAIVGSESSNQTALSEGWDDVDDIDLGSVSNTKDPILSSVPQEEIIRKRATASGRPSKSIFPQEEGLRQRPSTTRTSQGPSISFQEENAKAADAFFAGLSKEKRMLLTREHEELLEQFEGGLDQIRTATESLQAISNLQSQMAHHLQVQEKAIEGLHEDAWQATSNVESANVYLLSSKKLFQESRQFLLVFFIVASFSLLFLDWWYS